jgi:hypothetical protein
LSWISLAKTRIGGSLNVGSYDTKGKDVSIKEIFLFTGNNFQL